MSPQVETLSATRARTGSASAVWRRGAPSRRPRARARARAAPLRGGRAVRHRVPADAARTATCVWVWDKDTVTLVPGRRASAATRACSSTSPRRRRPRPRWCAAEELPPLGDRRARGGRDRDARERRGRLARNPSAERILGFDPTRPGAMAASGPQPSATGRTGRARRVDNSVGAGVLETGERRSRRAHAVPPPDDGDDALAVARTTSA